MPPTSKSQSKENAQMKTRCRIFKPKQSPHNHNAKTDKNSGVSPTIEKSRRTDNQATKLSPISIWLSQTS